VGRAGFGDALRPDALPAMRALRARGWNLEILSGDDPAVVDTVARDLGVPPENVRGGASPEDKLAAIAAAERRGPVVMVGDGVNDAAAISRSSVGIGVRGGAEACLAASDVYLARAGVGALVELVDGAHRTLAHVRRGIAFSLVYNAVGATLAAGGIINPLIAALLMPASSLTVVLAATLGPTFDAKPVASSEAPEDGTRRGTIAAAMGEAA
jgi:Cu2+-exporting ATPase